MKVYKNGVLVPDLVVQIRKDIPVPTERYNGAVLSATARKMEVGDSIDLPYSRKAYTSNMTKATGWKFTQRTTVLSNGLKVIRVWRIG